MSSMEKYGRNFRHVHQDREDPIHSIGLHFVRFHPIRQALHPLLGWGRLRASISPDRLVDDSPDYPPHTKSRDIHLASTKQAEVQVVPQCHGRTGQRLRRLPLDRAVRHHRLRRIHLRCIAVRTRTNIELVLQEQDKDRYLLILGADIEATRLFCLFIRHCICFYILVSGRWFGQAICRVHHLYYISHLVAMEI